MPTRQITFDKAAKSLSSSQEEKTLDNYSTIISTSLGSTLIEIQGELNLPTIKPDGLSEDEEALFIKSKIPELLTTQDQELVKDAVKFGKLEIDPDFQKATLFISNSQRLVGNVQKVDPPLGVLRLISNSDANENEDGRIYEQESEIVDVIRQKVVFKLRPLPIM